MDYHGGRAADLLAKAIDELNPPFAMSVSRRMFFAARMIAGLAKVVTEEQLQAVIAGANPDQDVPPPGRPKTMEGLGRRLEREQRLREYAMRSGAPIVPKDAIDQRQVLSDAATLREARKLVAASEGKIYTGKRRSRPGDDDEEAPGKPPQSQYATLMEFAQDARMLAAKFEAKGDHERAQQHLRNVEMYESKARSLPPGY